ncbi:hypothetical protein ACFGVR_11695 [Mucilaginibacter sp. AW1-3]
MIKNPIKIILLIAALYLNTGNVIAQRKSTYDTLYYFFDLSRIPVKDRMITVDSEMMGKFYTINCPCLKLNRKPVFRCDTTRRTAISYASYKKFRFVSLPQLIDIVKKNDFNELMKRYVIYFIQPSKKGFTKNEAFLQEENTRTTIDYITMPADTSKKRKPQ